MGFVGFVVPLLLQVILLRTTTAQFRDVRLVGGLYQWEGRVEIFTAGSWGTVTESDWTSEDARAVCRMMGYFRPGASPLTGAYFGQGGGPIHYDHIQCSGMEYNLTECETGKGTRQSSHDEDVGVKCNTIDENYRNGDIRLVGGPTNWEGRVEIFWNGTWGTISDSDWGTSEAQVVCKQHQLPSEGAVSYSCCSQYGAGTGEVKISSISCSGSEPNITQCSFSETSTSNHQNDVGVRCGEGSAYKSGDIRLVGGSYSWEGRVEIYLNGEWGTISYEIADKMDAHVVCRQLGYDTRYGYFDKSYEYFSHFGEGSGAVHLNLLECSGNEYRLVNCDSSPSDRDHSYDWSITCKNDVPDPGEVLLIYSYDRIDTNGGLLLVWLNDQWGTVSDDSWTIEDTNAVCQTLGRNGESTDSDYNDYELEEFPVVMSNVSCVGTESRLIDCPYTTGGSGSPVSMSCSSASCRYGDIRLTGGITEYEGRVEMCNSRSIWGTLCGRQWTEANSKVVCLSLGYGIEEGTYQTFNSNPTTPIAVDYVQCTGSEISVKECIHFSHSFSGCSHDNDVGIRCQQVDCVDGDVRLLDYADRDYYGDELHFVLLCLNNRWGPICSNNRGGNANTLCTQFGYANYGYERDRLISIPVQNISLQCSGDESRISDCPYEYSTPSSCYRHINIECDFVECTDGQVRLVDGDTEVEGRLEICFSRRWGTISDDGWTQTESTIVCNDLGYETPDMEYSAVRPAPNSMPVYMSNVRCSGRELSLLECGFGRAPTVYDHLKDIAVRCKSEFCDGDLRLTGGDLENEGVLQVCFNKRWGTVNGDGWTDVDTGVACRQLGFNYTGTYSATFSNKRPLSIPMYMDNVGCYGTEAKLTDCAYDTDTSEDTHYGDVWIDCGMSSGVNSKPNGNKNSFDMDSNNGNNSQTTDTGNNGGNNGGMNNAESTDKDGDSDSGNDAALILAILAFVGFILVSAAFVSSIFYIIWNKQRACGSVRMHFLKEDTKMITTYTDDPEEAS